MSENSSHPLRGQWLTPSTNSLYFKGVLKKSLGRISGRLRFLAQIIGLRPRQSEGVGSLWGIAVSANRIKKTNQVFFYHGYFF